MCSEILREEWQWWKGAVCICIHHKPITGLISLPLSRRINLQGQRGVSWWLKPQQEEAGWAVPCLATQPCLHRSWSCLMDTQKGLHSIWLQHLRGNTWTEWPEHITNTWRPGHVCRWPTNRFTLDSVQSLQSINVFHEDIHFYFMENTQWISKTGLKEWMLISRNSYEERRTDQQFYYQGNHDGSHNCRLTAAWSCC